VLASAAVHHNVSCSRALNRAPDAAQMSPLALRVLDTILWEPKQKHVRWRFVIAKDICNASDASARDGASFKVPALHGSVACAAFTVQNTCAWTASRAAARWRCLGVYKLEFIHMAVVASAALPYKSPL
jgi:hypothetical protein